MAINDASSEPQDGLDLDDRDDEDSTFEQAEPLDLSGAERKLVTQPYDLGVKGINDDIKRGRLLLTIEYQRKYVWDPAKAGRLIESLLLNVPIPVCYFAEDENGNYEVIDGLQRLTTIRNFLNDEMNLSGLSVLKELEGKLFSQLNPRDQRRLENRTIRCIVITDESHPDIKFDVFERLNTGAASLTSQELRNCIYRGKFNDSLKELSDESYFKTIVGSGDNRRMEYEELILRFFSLTAAYSAYKPPLRQYLNTHMRNHRNEEIKGDDLEKFRKTCEAVRDSLGDAPFKLPTSRNAVNKALFDSIMIPAAFADHALMRQNSNSVKRLRQEMLEDPEFLQAIGRATADRKRMETRVSKFADGLRGLGIGVDLPDLRA